MTKKEWCWVLLSFALVIGGGMYFVHSRQTGTTPVTAEEASAVAERLLAGKLSGPRYFAGNEPVEGEEGGPWIDVTEAVRQIPEVAAARGLPPGQTDQLKKIAISLAESHPSRVVGGGRINLNQLNLTIDSTFP